MFTLSNAKQRESIVLYCRRHRGIDLKSKIGIDSHLILEEQQFYITLDF